MTEGEARMLVALERIGTALLKLATPPTVFDVRHVASTLYTWHFEGAGKTVVGFGSRADAVTAAREWLTAQGGSDHA